MSFTQVLVVATRRRPGGAPAEGALTLIPSARMTNGGESVTRTPESASYDPDGRAAVLVAAVDDPGTSQVGVTYQVIDDVHGQGVQVYYVQVPSGAPLVAGVRTVDLDSLDKLAAPILVTPISRLAAASDVDTASALVGRALIVASLDPLTFGFADIGGWPHPAGDPFPAVFTPTF